MAGLAVSCAKSQIGGETPLLEEEAPVPIQLTTNLKVNSVSVTKAGVDQWNAQKLYIYALPTNKIPASGESEEVGKILVENAEASAPATNQADENKYIALDIELFKDANADPKTYYYYPTNKETYDFYGYYVGTAFKETTPGSDEKPNPVITVNEKISLPLFLDGSQDIMLAKADKDADVLAPGVRELISPANAYSAYSARKDVKPNLKFEHQLSRFVFNVVAGNDEGEKVMIKRVTLTSQDKATLIIADKNDDRGIKNPSGSGTFVLKDADGNDVTSWFPKHKVVEGESYTFVSEDRVGESIMVIPNNEQTEIKDRKHKLVILMQQMSAAQDGTELGDDFSYVYDLTPDMVVPAGDKFLPGYQYNVKVVVYGREKVLVSVQLTKWAEGGSITIDNDKEWGDEPKLGLKATKDNADYYLYFYDSLVVNTEVRVWDQSTNKMVPAAPGTYKFAVKQGTDEAPIWYVTLASEGEGENLKTVVTALSPTDPAETPGTE